MNNGYAFADAIKDLNIINIELEEYSVQLKYKNGLTAKSQSERLDMFDQDSMETAYLCDDRGNNFVDVEFSPANAVFDPKTFAYIINPENLHLSYMEKDRHCQRSIEVAKSTEVEYLLIKRKGNKKFHYTI